MLWLPHSSCISENSFVWRKALKVRSHLVFQWAMFLINILNGIGLMTTDPRCKDKTCDWYQESLLHVLGITATVRCRYTVCGIDGRCFANLLHGGRVAGGVGVRLKRVPAGVLKCLTKCCMLIAA